MHNTPKFLCGKLVEIIVQSGTIYFVFTLIVPFTLYIGKMVIPQVETDGTVYSYTMLG